MGYVVTALRAGLGLVFLLSFLGKVRDRGAAQEFIKSIRTLRLVPSWSVHLAASTILLAEAAVVGLMVFRATSTWGFVLAAVLMAVFSAAVGFILSRGETPTCRCFGAASLPIGGSHLARNLILLMAAVVGAASTIVSPPAPAHPAGSAIAFGVGTLIAIPIRFLDEIVNLFIASSVVPRPAAPRHSPNGG